MDFYSRKSIAATSIGYPEEDELVEKAIRASVVELLSASSEGNYNEAIQRAVQASVAQATQPRQKPNSETKIDGTNEAEDGGKELEMGLQRTVQKNRPSQGQTSLGSADIDDSGIDTDDDDNIKAASEKSMSVDCSPESKDDDLEKAVELSKQAHEEHEQGVGKSKTEEEIVLEYVKKQSLAEERHKKSGAARGGDFT